jgi:hypothetical protein|tara:strand:+ start:1104 stop:1277 length:174 start_codon:yes stop_codon:yes gene_type:complete
MGRNSSEGDNMTGETKRNFGNETTNAEYDMYMKMSHEQLAVLMIRYRTYMGELEVDC